MTDARWPASREPLRMLRFLTRRVTDRKLRLISAACLRSVASAVTDFESLQLIARYEDYAAGLGPFADVIALRNEVHDQPVSPNESRTAAAVRQMCSAVTGGYPNDSSAFGATLDILRYAAWVSWSAAVDGRRPGSDEDAGIFANLREDRIQAGFIREIVGNPFRPVAFDPVWLTSTVTTLAAGVYADRAFDRLPILADALEEAGCDNADVLTHCRSDGPHVRGCWVVDSVLGRE